MIEEYVIEELIKSTQTENGHFSVPRDTRLLSAEVKNGVCVVNFSKEFVDNRPDTAAGQRLAVYSIVNSLVGLGNIEEVKFLIEGKAAEGYEYIDISDSFTAFEDIVYDPREVSQLYATVYLGNSETGKLVKTPVIIDKSPELSTEECVVRYVLSVDDIGGYDRVIPYGVKLIGIEMTNGVCRVDLTMSLFAGGDLRVATLASCAIAASIIDSGAADHVTITVEGRKYLENIEQYLDLIVE